MEDIYSTILINSHKRLVKDNLIHKNKINNILDLLLRDDSQLLIKYINKINKIYIPPIYYKGCFNSEFQCLLNKYQPLFQENERNLTNKCIFIVKYINLLTKYILSYKYEKNDYFINNIIKIYIILYEELLINHRNVNYLVNKTILDCICIVPEAIKVEQLKMIAGLDDSNIKRYLNNVMKFILYEENKTLSLYNYRNRLFTKLKKYFIKNQILSWCEFKHLINLLLNEDNNINLLLEYIQDVINNRYIEKFCICELHFNELYQLLINYIVQGKIENRNSIDLKDKYEFIIRYFNLLYDYVDPKKIGKYKIDIINVGMILTKYFDSDNYEILIKLLDLFRCKLFNVVINSHINTLENLTELQLQYCLNKMKLSKEDVEQQSLIEDISDESYDYDTCPCKYRGKNYVIMYTLANKSNYCPLDILPRRLNE